MGEIQTRGFRRPTKKHTDAWQIDRLADAGVPVDRTEVEWASVPQAIRDGDTLALVHLHLLAEDEPTFLARCRDLAAIPGVTIWDVTADQRYDPASLAAFPAVKAAWQSEKAVMDKAEAKRRGQKGGRPEWAEKGSPAYKAALAYLKQDKPLAEIIGAIWHDHKVSVSAATLKRMRAGIKTNAK